MNTVHKRCSVGFHIQPLLRGPWELRFVSSHWVLLNGTPDAERKLKSIYQHFSSTLLHMHVYCIVILEKVSIFGPSSWWYPVVPGQYQAKWSKEWLCDVHENLRSRELFFPARLEMEFILEDVSTDGQNSQRSLDNQPLRSSSSSIRILHI